MPTGRHKGEWKPNLGGISFIVFLSGGIAHKTDRKGRLTAETIVERDCGLDVHKETAVRRAMGKEIEKEIRASDS